MKRLITLVNILIIILGVATFAGATLIDRGNGLIYDDDLDITWLQDINYAYSSGYQLYNPQTYQGRMSWAEAMIWAENLVYEGYDDWRLPTTLVPDPYCGQWAEGYNCRGSELGHLFYDELGNTVTSMLNMGPFINMDENFPASYIFWSSTLDPRDSPRGRYAYGLDFSLGGKQYGGISVNTVRFAWAVQDGDVASLPEPSPIPEPSTMLLFGSGLAGISLLRKRLKA